MIVLDIETSGLDTGRNGIWQIGALDLDNPKNTFLEESKIDNEDEIMQEALEITGKTEEELKDKNKQSQKQMIENFLNWTRTCNDRIIGGHNVGFDIMFIQNKSIRYGLRSKFSDTINQKTIDLHTVANLIYKKKHGNFKMENKRSSMNLSAVLELCGLKDNRIQMSNGKIIKAGEPHNALKDAKLTAECFKILLKQILGEDIK